MLCRTCGAFGIEGRPTERRSCCACASACGTCTNTSQARPVAITAAKPNSGGNSREGPKPHACSAAISLS